MIGSISFIISKRGDTVLSDINRKLKKYLEVQLDILEGISGTETPTIYLFGVILIIDMIE